MYTFYLDTSHWRESAFKVMGIKPLEQRWENELESILIAYDERVNTIPIKQE